MNKPIIPVFYACDDNFVKFTIVSLKSMIDNASKDFNYSIHILHTNVSDKMQEAALKLKNENFDIEFNDCTDYLKSISDMLPIRDYYSKTTYYRLFISEMFKEYDKAIYIDSDTIVLGDISKLYNHDISNYYVGACQEQAMVQEKVYGDYVEAVCGINRYEYFNAGMLLINCKMFREKKVLNQFVDLLHVYNFRVTQDEDYLNVICHKNVFWLENSWNTEVFGEIKYSDEEINIIHYIMVSKPWHYKDCRLEKYFWKYASQTEFYEDILNERDTYPEEKKKIDMEGAENLSKLAIYETQRDDSYYQMIKKKSQLSEDRLAVLERIEQYEKEGKFDCDVENDVPGREIKPGEVDYLKKKLSSKLRSKIAYKLAHKFVDKLQKERQFIIKEIRGIENFNSLDTGAIITCNHFNAFDSFAMEITFENSKHFKNKKKFFRIINEANYTSYPGFYGTLMRDCNTLPLSRNQEAMHQFAKAIDTLLNDGNFVLVYPEQSMWWNYRKPKPLKKGAFQFSARANVPVLPCFIAMEDSDVLDQSGYPVQEYTIIVGKPIYPNPDLKFRDNVNYQMSENYKIWKEIYEDFYGRPLAYSNGLKVEA